MRFLKPASVIGIFLGCSACLCLSCSFPVGQVSDTGLSSRATALPGPRYETRNALILPPIQPVGEERLLIIFPGMKKDATEYESLAREIQAATPQRLWVAMLNFVGNMTNPAQAGALVDSVMFEVGRRGFPDVSAEKTTLAGHSMGGIIAQGYIKNRSFSGLVLLSSYLTKVQGASALPQFEKPVLTVSGELDGQTRVTRVALDAHSAMDLAASVGDAKIVREKAVVVLPGVNHSQFAGRERMPDDLNPEVSYEDAQKAIAATVSDFLVLNDATAGTSPALKEQALARMTASIVSTRTMIAPYWQSEEQEQRWCLDSQRAEVPEAGRSKTVLITQEVFGNDFAFAQSKPKIDAAVDSSIEINATVQFKHAMNPMDISTYPEAAQVIACKMKSRDAIGSVGGVDAGPAVSCAESNIRAYEWALAAVSPSVRDRFLKRGRTLKILDDRNVSSGVQWITAGIDFKNSDSERVTSMNSTSLLTGINAPFGLGGMHYCKFLSPARAVEWIMVDGLRD